MFSRLCRRLLTAGLFCLISPAFALTDAEAVNTAGLQRMLSQRIAKNYLMLGQNILRQEALGQREKSLAQFAANLETLKAYAPTPGIRADLDKVEKVWTGYRERVSGPVSKTEALKVLRQSDELLKLSETAVKDIQDHAGVPAARIVNLSGRQRMLSQRIAKLYLAKSWGLTYDGLDQDFQKSLSDYEAALATLNQAAENTPEIRESLRQVDNLWRFSVKGFDLSQENLFVPTAICSSTESLLTHMQTITKLYEQQMQLVATR